ncbi:MAG: hypothetical protein KC917_11515 [Candidatus Omnitrophica bacterium]|nr:hypothetical protein [Candidatus Omnitrophota bacterium]
MSNRRKGSALLFLLVILTVGAIGVWPDRPSRYSLQILSISEGRQVTGIELNNFGHLAVSLKKGDQYENAFLWRPGRDPIEVCPECRQVFIRDLNDHDEMVGNYIGEDRKRRPFYWSESTGLVELSGELMSASSEDRDYIVPVAINNSHDILLNIFSVSLMEGYGRSNLEDGIGPGGKVYHDPIGGYIRSGTIEEFSFWKAFDDLGFALNNEGWALGRDGKQIAILGDGERIVLFQDEPGEVSRHVETLTDSGEVFFFDRSRGQSRVKFWKQGEENLIVDFDDPSGVRVLDSNGYRHCLVFVREDSTRYQILRWLEKQGMKRNWLPTIAREWFKTASVESNFLFDGKTLIEVERLTDLPRGTRLEWAGGLNDAGQIAACGRVGEEPVVLLLSPRERS